MRTIFLLEYLSDVDLRRLIQSATNKSERFNQFVQWVAFGGGALAAEGVRDEQRKFIKYNHLVANLLIYHNVVTMTKALQRLAVDAIPSTKLLFPASARTKPSISIDSDVTGLNTIEFRSPSIAFGY